MRLKAEKVTFGYNKKQSILTEIDFFVESGEVVGLVAPSGFGKTTLAKLLAGYEKPIGGRVLLDRDITPSNGANQRSFGAESTGFNPVQLIFQHPEKAVNPLWKMKKIVGEAEPPTKEMIHAMGISEDWMERWPSELSGGELQRFCVLRALTKRTKFIIADEMTTMLDAITQAQIWTVVLDYAKRNNIGVVVISHERELINKICHRIVDLTLF